MQVCLAKCFSALPPQGGEPVRPGVAMTDLATGLYAHGAIMAGLLQQQRTGRGSHIDCNLLSSQVSWTLFLPCCSSCTPPPHQSPSSSS